MGTPAQLFWGVIFGAVGSGYFIYGKKQQASVPLFAGILLCVFPYFIANTLLMLLVGFILIAVPFFIK
ncbi:Amino acid transport protein [Candidatus Electronema halotolerans]|jgi:hypothetical protein